MLAGALVVSGTGLVTPGSAYAASVDPAREACPADQVPAGAFDDVPTGTDAGRAADCLAGLGIAEGVGPRTFRPAAAVTRGQMVLFLARVAYLGAPGPIDFSQDPARFRDIDLDQLSEELAQALATLTVTGVVTGRPDGSFGPTDGVSRAQMAMFLTRLHDTLGAAPLPVGSQTYDDLDGLSPEAKDAISRITEAGIAQGVGPGRFAPEAGVSRQQMALFLSRLLQVEVAAGAVVSPYAAEDASPMVSPRFPQLRMTARTDSDRDDGVDLVTYVLLGLAPNTDYTVALLTAEQVSGTFRAAVFTDADSDGLADPPLAGGPGTVMVLDGTEDEDTGGQLPPPGRSGPTDTFTTGGDDSDFALVLVQGTGQAGAVRPVVYRTEGGLALRPDGTAAVPVGIGGRLTYSDRAATDPPKVLSAVGIDDPSGDRLIVTFDKPVRRGALYLLVPPDETDEAADELVLQELSGGGTTQITLRVPTDLRAADQDAFSLLILAADAAGNELAPIVVTPDLSNTA